MPAAHSVRHQAPRSEQAAPFQAVAAELGQMSDFEPWRGSFGRPRWAQGAFTRWRWNVRFEDCPTCGLTTSLGRLRLSVQDYPPAD